MVLAPAVSAAIIPQRRTLPPLDTFRFFETPARYFNFTNAAQEMQVAHGAVSQRIKRLEEHLEESGAAADACC